MTSSYRKSSCKLWFLKLSDDSSYEDFGMDVKGEALLQLLNKSKLRNETNMFLLS